jgi:cell division protein FtsQ
VRAAAALPRAAGAVGNGLGALRGRIGTLSPHTRRRLLALAALLALLTTVHYAWFRDSSFVQVEDVTVTGLRTEDGARIKARLIEAGERQSTLHVDEDALRRAIPVGAAVADLRVSTDFPHGMTIHVVQHPPVAVLVAGGQRVAVAEDGSLLKGVRPGRVPSIAVGALPGSGRLGRGRALRLVGVAAAAPTPLRARIQRIRQLPAKGYVAYLSRGPQVILGDATALEAKWAAAAAVLADGASRGAAYVDVRIPERPVAGGVEVPQPEPEQPPAGAGAQPPGAPPAPGTPGAQAPGAAPGAAGTPGAAETPPAGTAPGAAGSAPAGTAPTTASPTG